MRKKTILRYIVIGLIAVNVCYLLVRQQITMHRIQSQIEQKAIEAQKLKLENEKLQDEVKMSQSDKYAEKLAREKLGLIKEGEVPVINSSK